jgi:hypothetical protein
MNRIHPYTAIQCTVLYDSRQSQWRVRSEYLWRCAGLGTGTVHTVPSIRLVQGTVLSPTPNTTEHGLHTLHTMLFNYLMYPSRISSSMFITCLSTQGTEQKTDKTMRPVQQGWTTMRRWEMRLSTAEMRADDFEGEVFNVGLPSRQNDETARVRDATSTARRRETQPSMAELRADDFEGKYHSNEL